MKKIASKIGYVVKRYPRFSETFVVNEILAHEAAGQEIEIFALRPPTDTHFQDIIARVRGPVEYLQHSVKAVEISELIAATNLVVEPAGLARLGAFCAEEDPRDVWQAVDLARLTRSRGVGHLHAHFATSAASVARMAAAIADVPYSITAHAKDIFHESVSDSDLERKLRSAKFVVTVSDFNKRFLQTRYGDAASTVVRIYNGLDLTRFEYEPPTVRSPLIVAVGRLVEKKGFRYLIDAVDLLRESHPDVKCEIIGSGELEQDLEAQITDRGLAKFVNLVGPLPQAEVVKRLRQAAVLAAPCVVGADGNRDGLPTVLLEAMALGTPCVATPVTGIPEAIIDRETGLIVPEADSAGLAHALSRLLVSGPLREMLAGAARQRIEAHFDVHTSASLIREQVTTSAVGHRGAQNRRLEVA